MWTRKQSDEGVGDTLGRSSYLKVPRRNTASRVGVPTENPAGRSSGKLSCDTQISPRSVSRITSKVMNWTETKPLRVVCGRNPH